MSISGSFPVEKPEESGRVLRSQAGKKKPVRAIPVRASKREKEEKKTKEAGASAASGASTGQEDAFAALAITERTAGKAASVLSTAAASAASKAEKKPLKGGRRRAAVQQKEAVDESTKVALVLAKMAGNKAAIDTTLSWLKEFLTKPHSDTVIKAIIATIKTSISAERRPLSQAFVGAEMVIHAFEQIEKQKGFEDSPLTLQEILQHALFIAIEIPKVENVRKELFKKAETSLSRTVQHDPETRTAFLLADHRLNEKVPEGTYKRFAGAIALPLKNLERSFVAGRCFTKIKIAGELITKVDVDAVTDEFRLGAMLKSCAGIVPVYAITNCTVTYTTKAGEKAQAPRVSAICKIFSEGSLESVFDDPASMSMAQKLQVLKYMVYGLTNFHAKKLLHGDLKPENVYFGPLDKRAGTVEAAIGDFGFVSLFANGKPIDNKASINSLGYYNQGFYGSIYYTAPELFGVTNFAGDHEKVEAFALSVLMEQLIADKNPPFAQIINDCYENNFQKDNTKADYLGFKDPAALQRDQARVLRSVKTSRDRLIPPLTRKIASGTALSEAEIYTYIMCRLGHSNPEARINMREAKELLDKFLPNVEPKSLRG